MTQPASMGRRAGYTPGVAGAAPPPGPDTRAAVSPRMHNIANFILSDNPKQLGGIENSMGRMSIGVMNMEGDVNQNKAELSGSLDNTKPEENGNISPGAGDSDGNIRQAGSCSGQESPSQDEKNGNVSEDGGQYSHCMSHASPCPLQPALRQCPVLPWKPVS